MSRLTRDGTAEPVSRDQILRRERGQGNIIFPCSVDHEWDWQPYPVDPYSAICNDHTYIHSHAVVLGDAVAYGRYSEDKTAEPSPAAFTVWLFQTLHVKDRFGASTSQLQSQRRIFRRRKGWLTYSFPDSLPSRAENAVAHQPPQLQNQRRRFQAFKC